MRRFIVVCSLVMPAAKMAGLEGLEPPTTWFEARYSIRLSYRPACVGIVA